MSVPGVHVQESLGSLPPELQAAYHDIRNRAIGLSARGYEGVIPADRVAPMPRAMRHAAHLADQSGAEQALFNRAQDLMRREEGQAFTGNNAARYMNPYQRQVAERIAELGNRNFQEKILPALSSEFIKAGQHGSTRHAKLARKAARDVQREISAEQGALMHKGYGEAMQAFNWDRARQSQLAEMMGKLGLSSGASRIANIEALSKVGGAERELAQFQKDIENEEHNRQKQHDYDMLSFLTSIMEKQPYVPSTYNVSRVPRPQSSMRSGDWQHAGAAMVPGLLEQIMRRRG